MFINALRNVRNSIRSTFSFSTLYFSRHRPHSGNETANQLLSVHVKGEAGRFRTRPEHIAPQKISGVERGTAWLLNKASLIGPHTTRWAESMLKSRGIQGVRVLIGLLSLAGRHARDDIERACEVAQTHGAYRLRVIRELIKHNGKSQEQFEFMTEHPIIRRLSDYGDLVRNAFQETSV